MLSTRLRIQIKIKNLTHKGELKIAIPLAEGKLTMHFGHCASFTALVDVDPQTKKIIKTEEVAAFLQRGFCRHGWLSAEQT